MNTYRITATGERILITQAELDASAAIQATEAAARVIPGIVSARKAQYRALSDPMFLEWQYTQDPADETKWRDAVAEIKTNNPFPT